MGRYEVENLPPVSTTTMVPQKQVTEDRDVAAAVPAPPLVPSKPNGFDSAAQTLMLGFQIGNEIKIIEDLDWVFFRLFSKWKFWGNSIDCFQQRFLTV